VSFFIPLATVPVTVTNLIIHTLARPRPVGTWMAVLAFLLAIASPAAVAIIVTLSDY
jgi:hypothetical protein